jgi:fructose-1,6-bisphosphatase/inositol monophosphatase family enzyme
MKVPGIDGLDAAAVARLIRSAAEGIILPRFGRLLPSDVSDKGINDPVTVADLECEAFLRAGMAKLAPDVPLLGEESIAADPASKERILAGKPVFVADPIDGTLNFAAGTPLFVVQLALFIDARPVAAWIFDPVADKMAIAVEGAGTTINGKRITMTPKPSLDRTNMALSIYLPPYLRKERAEQVGRLAAKATGFGAVASLRCIGQEFLACLEGRLDAIACLWSTAWDMGPGALMVREAGGACLSDEFADWDAKRCPGSFVAAPSPEQAREIAAIVAECRR